MRSSLLKFATVVAAAAATLAVGTAAQASVHYPPRPVHRIIPVPPPPSLCVGHRPRACPVHRPKPATTRTCVPQYTLHVGIYQFDNDLFAGKAGPSCVTVTPSAHSLTIDRNYRAQPGGVVAYPAVRVGDYPYNRDRQSRMPAPVATIHRWLHLRNTGSAPGSWITDVDTWFARKGTPGTDHNREMIIVTRWRKYGNAGIGRLVKIGRHQWYVSAWPTGPAGHKWLLMRFIAFRQLDQVTINVHAFLKVARKQGWLRNTMLVSSISDGTECWSGCRGLTDAMTVRG